MTEPEESLATIEDERQKFNNAPHLIEPKEEPLDDFLSASVEREIPQLDYLNENDCKKEEMLEDSEMLASYGTVEKSEETAISSLSPVEPKFEVLEDRVVIAVENPIGLKFFDDLHDEAEEPLNETFADYPEGNHSSSMGESDREDDQPMKKKSKLDSITKKQSTRNRSDDEDCQSESVTKNDAKRSETEMECTKCDFSTKAINYFFNHLREKHCTTPAVEGIVLRCECGHESSSAHHNRKKYPATVHGYADHLNYEHKTTLIMNGIYLRCACGHEVASRVRNSGHSKKCDGREYTVQKLENKVSQTPQCVLCEKYPKTVRSYAEHISGQHKSTLNKCGGRQFTLHKLDEE